MKNATAQFEGIVMRPPEARAVPAFDGVEDVVEEVAEFWIWYAPPFESGFDGAVAKPIRVIARGALGQEVLGFGQQPAFQRSDHVRIDGFIHPNTITHMPAKTKGRKPRRMRYPQHVFYLEVSDEIGRLDMLGRIDLRGTGIILHDTFETKNESLYDTTGA